MANLCSNHISITGPEKTIKDLQDKILHDETLRDQVWFLKPGGGYGLINHTDIEDQYGSLFLDVCSKWSPPEKELRTLSKMFPECTLSVQYEEPCMDLYGILEYKGGETIQDNAMDEETYLSEFDENFGDIMDHLETCSYKEFQEEYLDQLDNIENDPETFRFARYMEREIVKRIHDDDLPLLINHQWIDGGTLYRKRLEGNSK